VVPGTASLVIFLQRPMIKAAFFACLLGLLATAALPATARPAHTSWPFWLSKPERHGQRKLAGDFKPNYGTYRYHSHQDSNLFGFLHSGGRSAARHKRGPAHAPRSSHRRTSVIF
jgi:hypothetical protein